MIFNYMILIILINIEHNMAKAGAPKEPKKSNLPAA